MKKRRQKEAILRKLMRITLIQLILFQVFIGMGYAANLRAQEILNKRVTLSVSEQGIEAVLDLIEHQTDVRFLYSFEVIKASRKVSVDLKNERLERVLDELLLPLKIDYRVTNKRTILLKPATVKPLPQTTPTGALVQEEALAQEITGRVTDESGTGLPGVSVIVKGTQMGTSTDSDGKYRISPENADATLIFSFVGYLSQEVSVAQQTVIDISLMPDNKSLDELIVVGYGEQRRATVTGSVASVTSKEIKTTTNGNLTNMLAGKLPGFRVVQRNSEPGNYATDYDIRGLGSPLIIVDGIVRNNFNRLDPNEIESISVLKDAAAAVYGVRAANGVVLITTKRGKSGKVELSYSGTYGLSSIANSPKTLDAYGYALLTNEATINQGGNPPFSKQQLDDYKNGVLPSTNWYDLVVRKQTPQSQHNISATGGTDKVSYFVSLGYYNEQGIWKSGDLNYKRYNLRSNITAKLTKSLEVELLLNGFADNKNEPGRSTWEVFKGMWMQIPTVPIYANNNPAYYSSVPDALHPMAVTDANYSGYVKRNNKQLQSAFALNYDMPFLTGMKARFLYSYDLQYNFTKQWQKKFALYDYNSATDTYVPLYANNPSKLSQSFNEGSMSTVQASLDYTKTIANDHNLKVLALLEQRTSSGEAFNGNRQFSLDAVDQLYAGDALNQQVNSTPINKVVTQGLVGRLNYDYKGKYILEGSFRYDGSSKFAPDKRWGFFPAVSAGWRISEENFFRADYISNLKLRASIGKLGDDGSSSYQFLTGYNYPGNLYIFDETLVAGLGFRGMSNKQITWYTAVTSNVGIDADLFANRLHVEVDAFRRERSGLLATRILSLPETVGAALPEENLNSDLTRGFEVLLSHRNHIGELGYAVSANMSFSRTKNLYVERSASNNSYRNWRDNNSNRWNDVYWGYGYLGQFQSFEEIYASPVQDGRGNTTLIPGDIKYQDYNGDGVIDGLDEKPISINSNNPKVQFGTTVALDYKGFDFNVLFQGGTLFNMRYTEQLEAPLPWGRNGLDIFLDRWHKADMFNPDSPWVPGKYPSTKSLADNQKNSDYWVHNASYLRVKSLELGYTVPKRLLGKALQSVRVYANGFNLLTWSKLNSVVDPEHTNATYGYEYPIMRNYNIGVNVIF